MRYINCNKCPSKCSLAPRLQHSQKATTWLSLIHPRGRRRTTQAYGGLADLPCRPEAVPTPPRHGDPPLRRDPSAVTCHTGSVCNDHASESVFAVHRLCEFGRSVGLERPVALPSHYISLRDFFALMGPTPMRFDSLSVSRALYLCVYSGFPALHRHMTTRSLSDNV